MAAVQRVAHSIHQRVALPYRVEGVDLAVTAAIGVAMYPTDARSGTGLLRRADESMYRAKSQWTDPARVDGGSSAPARRRDDTAKRRAQV
jgi:GGDEF domain-containing protein